MSRRATRRAARSSAVCSPVSPTKWRCGSMPGRCAARSCTAARACWPAKAWCSSAAARRERGARDRGEGAERQVLLTHATAIEEEWLRELFPEGFRETTEVRFDSVQRRVVARKTVALSRSRSALEGDATRCRWTQAAALLAREVEAGRCALKNWDDSVEQWIIRLNLLATWYPEWELPQVGDRGPTPARWNRSATARRATRKSRSAPSWPVVKSWLSGAQQELVDEYAPERMEMPNGRKFKIVYSAHGGARDRGAHPGSLRRRAGAADRRWPRPARHPGARAESPADPDHAESGELLERIVSEDQAGAAAEISQARVAVIGRFGGTGANRSAKDLDWI